MTSREKINAALAYLRSRGVRKSSAAPPIYHLLWALGIPIPPPHFQSFLGLLLLNGGFYFLIMTGVILGVSEQLETALVLGGLSGLVFGTVMAAFMRLQAGRLEIPKWHDFDPERTAEQEEEPDW